MSPAPRTENGWVVAEKSNGNMGMVPESYVSSNPTDISISPAVVTAPSDSKTGRDGNRDENRDVSSSGAPLSYDREAPGESGTAFPQKAVAVYDYVPSYPDELGFSKDAVLTLLSAHEDPQWFNAKRADGGAGVVPATHIRIVGPGDPTAADPAGPASLTSQPTQVASHPPAATPAVTSAGMRLRASWDFDAMAPDELSFRQVPPVHSRLLALVRQRSCAHALDTCP